MDGEREAPRIPLESIDKVPIAMFVATDDETCTYATAQETAAILGDIVTNFETFEDADHLYFWQQNDEEYMDLLISELQVPASAASVSDTALS